MKRVKRFHTVGQLLHVFLNGAAMDGHRAGAYSYTEKGVLYANGGFDPAAAFFRDATHQDGRAVVAAFGNKKWNWREIQLATPTQQVHTMLLQHCKRECISRRSVVEYFDSLFHSLVRFLEARISCPYGLSSEEALLNNLKDLLTLKWQDVAAHTRATDRLKALADEWRINLKKGEFESSGYVCAVAQRKGDVANAKAAEAEIQKCIKNGELPSWSRDNHLAALARVNIFGQYDDLIASFVAYKRGRLFEARKAALRKVMRDEALPLDRELEALLPDHVRARRQQLDNQRVRMAQRAARVDRERAMRNAAVELRRLHAQYKHLFTAEGIENTSLDAARSEIATSAEQLRVPYYRWQHNAASLSEELLAKRGLGGVWDIYYWLNQALTVAANAEARRNSILRKREATQRALVNAQLHIERGQPRSALAVLREFEPVQSLYGASPSLHESVHGDQAEAVRAQHAELTAQATAALESVSERQEWKDGGARPTSLHTDALIINGNQARTSRGVDVPLREARNALAYIDAQPPGPFRCSFGVDVFRLTGRDGHGYVHVGCHRFSPEEIDAFRQDLAAHDAIAAVEVAAA